MAAHLCDNEVTERLDSYTGAVTYGTEDELIEIYRQRIYPTFEEETEIGKEFYTTYAWTPEVTARVSALFARQFGVRGTPKSGVEYPGAILVWRLEAIVGDLMRIHDPVLTLANPPEVPRPEPEHLRKSRQLRKLRQEVEIDIQRGGISTDALKEKRKDPEYNRVYNEVMFPESPAADLPDLTDEAREFAEHYRVATSYDLKPKGGVYRLSGVSYGLEKFDRLMQIAVAHNLISAGDSRSIQL
jgi:hypothetical protein